MIRALVDEPATAPDNEVRESPNDLVGSGVLLLTNPTLTVCEIAPVGVKVSVPFVAV